MSSPHDDMMLLAPAYALGALDPDERRLFEQHLGTCDVCTQEVRSLSRVAAGLAQTPTQVSPRAELRGRVLTAVGASTSASAPASPVVPVTPRKPSSALPVWLPYAAMVAMAAGFGWYALDQRGQTRTQIAALEARIEESAAVVRDSEQRLADARAAASATQTVLGVLTAPDVVRIDLAGLASAPQASGRAMWSRQRGMVFSGTNLPPLPEGRVYQVWVFTSAGPAPVSAGVLTGEGPEVFITPPDIAPPRAVAVTIEAAGGVPAPTNAAFMAGAPRG